MKMKGPAASGLTMREVVKGTMVVGHLSPPDAIVV
jgi:hypothetical protein